MYLIVFIYKVKVFIKCVEMSLCDVGLVEIVEYVENLELRKYLGV